MATSKDTGQTIARDPRIAGQIAADKRADGYTVTVKSQGSDSKRGTLPWFVIRWSR